MPSIAYNPVLQANLVETSVMRRPAVLLEALMAAFGPGVEQVAALMLDLLAWSADPAAVVLDEMETLLHVRGRELMRGLLQRRLDVLAASEVRRFDVVDQDGLARPYAERGHDRPVVSLFGTVRCHRIAYRSRQAGADNRYLLDAALNLPDGCYSYTVRDLAGRLIADASIEATRGHLEFLTGEQVGKRQLEQIAGQLAADVEVFYAQRRVRRQDTNSATAPAEQDRPEQDRPEKQEWLRQWRREHADALAEGKAPPALVVVTADAGGVPVLPRELKDQAAKDAADGRLLDTGKPAGRKRMFQLAGVYSATPIVRTADDIIADPASPRRRADRPGNVAGKDPAGKDPAGKKVWPKAVDKTMFAGIRQSAEQVIGDAVAEAAARIETAGLPGRIVALVDGNAGQLNALARHAAAHDLGIFTVLDVMHVLGYLHKAGDALYPADKHQADKHQADKQADKQADDWVARRARDLLRGQVAQCIGLISNDLHAANLPAAKARPVQECLTYLRNHQDQLRYDIALELGTPIATGVIEGTVRHILRDRLDRTGCRWTIDGAEHVARLRVLLDNTDYQDYLIFHKNLAYQRIHQKRYTPGLTLAA